MYCKAKLFDDSNAAERVLRTKAPSSQKLIGRNVAGFNDAKWELFREGVVFSGNFAKFSQNLDLRDLLLATGSTTIVEASPKDTIWGVGLAEDDERIVDQLKWRGANLLGKALMRVRACLMAERQAVS